MYQKILFLGNSITKHAPAPQIGWNHDFGMAASEESKDFVHLIAAAYPQAEYRIQNLSAWERAFWEDEVLEHYRELADWGADLLIVRLGENSPARTVALHAFAPAYEKMVDFFLTNPNAKVLLGTMFWNDPVKDEAVKYVGEKRGWPVADLTAIREDPTNRALGLFEHKGVAEHPGDKGMQAIADAFLQLM